MFFLFACSEKTEDRIAEQKFIDLYAHILILNEIENDSTRQLFKEKLLSHEGVTSKQVDSTLIYYKDNPETWPEVMRQIRDRIKELRAYPISLDSLGSG